MNALTNRRGVTPVRSAPVRSAPFRATLAALGTLVYAVTVCAVTGFAHDAVPWTANPQRVEQLSARAGFNYREANVPDYELPDPLTMNDSTQVATAPQWTNQRRGEVLELFRDQVYGRRPQTPYELRFETVAELPDAFAGLATGRSMKAIVTIEDRVFEFPFVLFTPNHTQGKTPAVIAINNRYAIPLEKAVAEADPFWPVKTMLERGYAAATFYTSDVDPDDKHGYAAGIRSFFADGQAPVDDAWRSLSAWGWGASRILDHFANVPSIDVTRVAVVGHSRGGKAALWCAAEDTRFAAAYSNNSGCGGAALSRRAYGETVKRITTAFPHWFCANFTRYADRESELPVDQHELIALVAPRAVYVASADEDLWADPRGEYGALVAAAPVFKLLGKASIEESSMPPLDQPRVAGQTGYHIRRGGHGLERSDWNHFLDFLDNVLP